MKTQLALTIFIISLVLGFDRTASASSTETIGTVVMEKRLIDTDIEACLKTIQPGKTINSTTCEVKVFEGSHTLLVNDANQQQHIVKLSESCGDGVYTPTGNGYQAKVIYKFKRIRGDYFISLQGQKQSNKDSAINKLCMSQLHEKGPKQLTAFVFTVEK